MRLWKSWIVTSKDLSVFKRNRYILSSLIAIPLIVGVVLPVVFIYAFRIPGGPTYPFSIHYCC